MPNGHEVRPPRSLPQRGGEAQVENPAMAEVPILKQAGLFRLLLQLLEKSLHVQNMLGLSLSKRGQNGEGVLRVMTVSFQLGYQCFLLGEIVPSRSW